MTQYATLDGTSDAGGWTRPEMGSPIHTWADTTTAGAPVVDGYWNVHNTSVDVKANIPADYEGKTFIVMEGIDFTTTSYERCANGKGEFKDRGNKKILPIKYTPDFIGDGFIIECKGRANESFPLRWKLFKKVVNNEQPHVILYKPQNHKECDKTAELILEQQNS